MSLILGQLVANWLLIGVEKRGALKRKGLSDYFDFWKISDLGYPKTKFSILLSRDAILNSLILGQLVAHWLLIGVEKNGSTQKEGSE